MYEAERGGENVGGAGAWVELLLAKLKLDPRPTIRWPGACSAV